MINQLKKILQRRKKSYQEAFFYSLDLDLAGLSRNYQAYAREGYALNFAARRAVQLVAQSSAAINPLLYQSKGKVDAEVNQHALLEILKRPNHAQSWFKFVEELTSYYKIAGQAFIRITAEGRNFELFALRPDKTTINEGKGWKEVESYTYQDEYLNATYSPEEIIHLKTFNPLHEYEGLSEFTSIGLEIDQKNLSSKWNVSILRNGGKPSHVVISKKQLQEEQFKRLKREIRTEYSGANSAGKIALFEGDELEIKPMSFTGDELSFIDGQKIAIAAIAANLGVAPELVGVTDAKKYANYQEAQKALYTETVIPWTNYVYGEINTRVTQRFGKNLYLKPWLESIEVLQKNKADEASRIGQLTKTNNITFGQAGLDLGYEVRKELIDRYQWEITYKLKWGVWPEEKVSNDKALFIQQAQKFILESEDRQKAQKIIMLAYQQEFDEPLLALGA